MNEKILIFDLETFPNIAYVWGKYDQNVIRFRQEGCIASFVAKWVGDPRIISKGLPNYSGYRPGSYNDKAIVSELWDLMDEADAVVAHNGKSFDVKVAQGRFIVHGLVPPSPFKVIDTKLEMRRVARLNSNKLDDIGALLNLGKKIKTNFDLWEGCIRGDAEAWAEMLRYNVQDVKLLEKVYLRLRPWMDSHPNMAFDANRPACPHCGAKHINYHGNHMTPTSAYRRFQCQECGGWGRDVRRNEKTGVRAL